MALKGSSLQKVGQLTMRKKQLYRKKGSDRSRCAWGFERKVGGGGSSTVKGVGVTLDWYRHLQIQQEGLPYVSWKVVWFSPNVWG